MRGTKWTPQEVAALQERYLLKNAKELASTFGRSPRALQEKAFVLGIRKNRSWATHEVRYLVDNYNKLNHKLIAAKLKRSPEAIRMYYMRLKRMEANNGDNTRGESKSQGKEDSGEV